MADGTLVEVLAPEGSDVDVGAPLCRYEAAGEAAAVPKEVSESLPASAPMPEAAPISQPIPAAAADRPVPADSAAPARPRATPVARRLAREAGVDLGTVRGTGRRGRIQGDDVRLFRPAPPGQSAGTDALAVKRWAAAGLQHGSALLLHGFGGDAQTWAAFAAHLSRRGFAVTAPDLPGHGATALDAHDVADLAAPLAELLAEGEPVELVGHSLGAAVAVALARLHPDRVARLTLLAPAGVGDAIDGDFVHGMARVQSAGGLSHLLRRLSPRPPSLSTAQLGAMAESLSAGRLVALADAVAAGGRQQIDIVADLETLPMPVRVVWGLADEVIAWTQVARLPTRVAIHLIPGVGHMPHWDAPQLVAALFDRDASGA